MIGAFVAPSAFSAFKRLTVKPSEKRAASPANALVESANRGNVTAAAAILYRTGIGIMKERAVWQAALQRLTPDMAMLAQRYQRQLLPLVDHSGPESAARTALANVRDASSFATPTRAEAPARAEPKVSKPVGAEATTRRPSAPSGRARAAGRSGARAAPRARLVWRYDPETGQRVHVPNDSMEAAEWPSRKPARKRASRVATQARSRALTAASRVVATGGLKFAGAVRAAGAAAGLGITATGAAIVGAFGVGLAIGAAINKLAAYLSVTERNERKALAFRAARQRFAVDNGRQMTPAEVRELGAGFKASLSR